MQVLVVTQRPHADHESQRTGQPDHGPSVAEFVALHGRGRRPHARERNTGSQQQLRVPRRQVQMALTTHLAPDFENRHQRHHKLHRVGNAKIARFHGPDRSIAKFRIMLRFCPMRENFQRISSAMLLFAAALPAQSGSAMLRKLCDEYTEFTYKSYPASATAAGRNEYNHQWQDLSPAAIESRRRAVVAFRERLRAIPANALSGEDRISAKLLERTLEQNPEGEHVAEMLLS